MLWLAVARAIHIAASILLAGLFAFRLVVLAPVASRFDWVDRFQRRFKGIWGRLALVAWLTLVVSAILWFGFVAASITGAAALFDVDGDTCLTVLLQTQFGHLWALRLVGCLIVGILMFSGSPELIIAVLSFAILASLAAAGHVPMGFPIVNVIATCVFLLTISMLSGLLSLGILKKSQPADLLR